MTECKCGYTRNVEKNCDGTHKVVKQLREDIAQKIDDQIDMLMPPVDNEEIAIYNALTWAAKVARGQE